MKLKWIFVLALTILGGQAALAQDERTPASEARDEEIAARAKRHLYPGGPDESDLKVQNPLPVPTRKVAPTVDESEPSAED